MESIRRSIRAHRRSRMNTDIGRFFSAIEDVRRQLENLKTHVEAVKAKQNDIVAMPSLPHDVRHQELEDLNGKVKNLSSAIRIKLRAIDKANKEEEARRNETAIQMESDDNQGQRSSSPATYVPVNIRIRKVQYSTYIKMFTDIMYEYQFELLKFRDSSKATLKRQLEITQGEPYTEEEVDELMEDGNFRVFTNGIQIETKQARKQFEDIQARHNDLIKLEKSLMELHELFHQMAIQVESQGEMITAIEENVIQTGDYVAKAVPELIKAREVHRKFVHKKIILGVVVFGVVVLILILIICAAVKAI